MKFICRVNLVSSGDDGGLAMFLCYYLLSSTVYVSGNGVCIGRSTVVSNY
jgi:hypothetical protein